MQFFLKWILFVLLFTCKKSFASKKLSKTQEICSHTDSTFWKCSNKNLTVLPDGLGPSVLQLDLSYNKFVHFPTNFNEATNITYLNFSHNNIQTISHNAFENLPALEILDLSYNGFRDWRDIVSSAFDNIPRIKFLDFSYNKFSQVNFKEIRSLEVLKLEKCDLLTMNNIIESGNYLRELHLSNNRIRNILENITSIHLEYLDLSNSGLSFISHSAFVGLSNLDTLLLRNNKRLRSLKLKSCSVVNLDLSQCSLETLPHGEFTGLSNVNLADNIIVEINNDTFTKFITKDDIILNLSSNAIKKLDYGSFNNVSCRSIDLSYNKISYIHHDLFKTQSSLEYLNLSHNYLHSLRWEIESLVYLDVSYNEICNVEVNDFEEFTNLKILKMSRNCLMFIPDMTYIPQVEALDVSHCRLNRLSNKTFLMMPKLRTLDVSNNQLTAVKPSFFPHIRNPNIINNSWHCECSKLKEMFEEKQMDDDLNLLICASPEKESGKTWIEACLRQWYPVTAKQDHIWYYSVACILILLSTFGILYMCKKKKEKPEVESRSITPTIESGTTERIEEEPPRQQSYERIPLQDPHENDLPPSYDQAKLYPKLGQTLASSAPDVSRRTKRRRRRKSLPLQFPSTSEADDRDPQPTESDL